MMAMNLFTFNYAAVIKLSLLKQMYKSKKYRKRTVKHIATLFKLNSQAMAEERKPSIGVDNVSRLIQLY